MKFTLENTEMPGQGCLTLSGKQNGNLAGRNYLPLGVENIR
jgi:hypothetical protein